MPSNKKTLIGGAILFVYFWVAWMIHDGAQKILSSMLLEYENDGGSKQTSYQRHNLSPINVAFGLSGDHPGFLSEFEAALKSLLLNAPMERNLHVHILADRDAFVSLDGIFNRTQLPTWVTRNPIEIHAYDITPIIPRLERQIVDTFNKTVGPEFELWHATGHHTVGTFYRLIAHHFIPPSVDHLLYMDTDVVIMANLESLWQEVEMRPDALFHWGSIMCAGFVVMNVPRIEEIWALAKSVPNMKNISKDNHKQEYNDQILFMSVNITYPNEVNILTEGWGMAVTGLWLPRFLPYNETRPNVGMLHVNGGYSSKGPYFLESSFMRTHKDTWGNAMYYAKLPWTWSRFQAKSTIRPGSEGHLIKIYTWDQEVQTPWSSILNGSVPTN